MREAIGSSLLFNLIIVIVIVMIAFLVGSLSYSKAFKVKNRIINIIEKYEGYNQTDSKMINEINSELKNMGYRINKNKKCKSGDISGSNSYEFCIYKKQTKTGSYYKVVTYMYFDIPIIGSLLHFPVSGETKIFYDTYINYE